MNYLSLDLEFNQNSGRIIQIGACIGNLSTGEYYSSFSQLVSIGSEPVSPYIEKLTGISTADLHSDGIPLIDAYRKLLEYVRTCPDLETNPITWGGGDSLELFRQLGPDAKDWPFGRRWLDIKTIHQMVQIAEGRKKEAGLANAMTRYRLKFVGRKHNAEDDAINTLILAQYLIRRLRHGR